jgi:hypothetical protein
MLAYTYPLADLFGTMLGLFISSSGSGFSSSSSATSSGAATWGAAPRRSG